MSHSAVDLKKATPYSTHDWNSKLEDLFSKHQKDQGGVGGNVWLGKALDYAKGLIAFAEKQANPSIEFITKLGQLIDENPVLREFPALRARFCRLSYKVNIESFSELQANRLGRGVFDVGILANDTVRQISKLIILGREAGIAESLLRSDSQNLAEATYTKAVAAFKGWAIGTAINTLEGPHTPDFLLLNTKLSLSKLSEFRIDPFRLDRDKAEIAAIVYQRAQAEFLSQSGSRPIDTFSGPNTPEYLVLHTKIELGNLREMGKIAKIGAADREQDAAKIAKVVYERAKAEFLIQSGTRRIDTFSGPNTPEYLVLHTRVELRNLREMGETAKIDPAEIDQDAAKVAKVVYERAKAEFLIQSGTRPIDSFSGPYTPEYLVLHTKIELGSLREMGEIAKIDPAEIDQDAAKVAKVVYERAKAGFLIQSATRPINSVSGANTPEHLVLHTRVELRNLREMGEIAKIDPVELDRDAEAVTKIVDKRVGSSQLR